MVRSPAKLHDEVAGQVHRLDLAPFLVPEADERGFIVAHYDRASEPPIKVRRFS